MSSYGEDGKYLAIRLEGERTNDGRIYVTSPDLEGFHFLVEQDEDPIEAMTPTLKTYVHHALDAEMISLQRVMTPHDFLLKEVEDRADELSGGRSVVPRTLIGALA